MQPAQKQTILIVDDNDDIRLVLERQLKAQGYLVIAASNGHLALQHLHTVIVDLVILDMRMPMMSGMEVLSHIRADQRMRTIPVVVVSADGDEHQIVECLLAGAEDYLVKPFNTIILQARVRACLEKKRLHDREQVYLQRRLARISKHQGSIADLAQDADALSSELRLALEEVEQEQAARQQVEEALRHTNQHLEHLVAMRTASLRLSEERYALAANATNDGLWDWDLLTNRIYFSARWRAMIGQPETDQDGHPDEWFLAVHPDDRDTLQVRLSAHLRHLLAYFEHTYRMLHRDGSFRWMSCRGLAVWDDQNRPIRIVGAQSDITERRLAEQRLIHEALHDPLTGLANRALMLERLGHALARSQRSETPLFAVLFFDLDRFKVINDSLGHLIGDQLLVGIARRIEDCLRPGDTFARLGGDEFTVLLEHMADSNAAVRVAERILESLQQPFVLGGREVFSGASIGITLSNGADYQYADALLRDADTAMYYAKLQGRGRYAIFNPSMHAQALAQLQLETDLRRGLERGELRVHYQPIVALSSQQVVGFEALCRWRHPERGPIPPSEFIPVAEETGLITQIGEWVLRTAVSQLQQWQRDFPSDPPLMMHVNVSPRQLQRGDLVAQVISVLNETGITPKTLTLEITESMLVAAGDEPQSLLRRLQALGVQLCIDDFGTGYSALNYLHRFPVDSLKIDRSFVHQMNANQENLELVRTIVALARSLDIAAVAEGTETLDQVSQLRSLACQFGQGWAFGAAVDSEHATALLTSGTLLAAPTT